MVNRPPNDDGVSNSSVRIADGAIHTTNSAIAANKSKPRYTQATNIAPIISNRGNYWEALAAIHYYGIGRNAMPALTVNWYSRP